MPDAVLPSASFEIELQLRRGPLRLDVAFTLRCAWTVLFAPSGAGKTTVLRMIAGLEAPDQGRIVCNPSAGPVVLCDTRARTEVSPYLRQIGMVAQRPALFPHLTVLQNVLYRANGPDAGEELISLLQLGGLLSKMPRQLSGGERQRVALARALASGRNDRLLLLDEPFSGLDGAGRQALIADLRRLLARRGTPVLMVSHDIGDVLATGAEVLRMKAGRIVASGPARDVLDVELTRLRSLLGS